jgi:hypothetical protein
MKALVPVLVVCLASVIPAGCDWQQPENEWVYENLTGNPPPGYEFGGPPVNSQDNYTWATDSPAGPGYVQVNAAPMVIAAVPEDFNPAGPTTRPAAHNGRDAEIARARAIVERTAGAVRLYHDRLGVYPTTEEGLRRLVEPPLEEMAADRWRQAGGPFLKNLPAVPVDPWGHELRYVRLGSFGGIGAVTGPEFAVWSAGSGGIDRN